MSDAPSIEDILKKALGLSSAEREAYLDKACGDDLRLRENVGRRLDGHSRAETTPISPAPHDRSSAKTVSMSETAGFEELATSFREIPTIVGHYEIQGKLGAGGMGEVYAAADRALGRKVAIKVLPPGFKPEIRDRLMREAWASAKLQYPGIATFYEAGTADGVDFIAMEFVPGKTLREHLKEGPLNPQRAIEITVRILEALSHAHYSGILHRDIKPANIMISEDGAPKLLDFGLARGLLDEDTSPAGGKSKLEGVDLDSEQMTALIIDAANTVLSSPSPDSGAMHLTGSHNLTQAGTVMGTFGYMPPEQLLGQAVDARTDIFAVGAVLYELVSGKPAFPGKNIQEKVRAILEGDPPELDQPDVPPELNDILARAMARLPANRYPAISEFLADLQGLQDEKVRSAAQSSLAILEFQVSDPDHEQVWLADALSQAIGSTLTRIPNISLFPPPRVEAAVRAPNPDNTPVEFHVGHTLGCRLVLSGRIDLEAGEARLRVTDVISGHRVLEEVLQISESEIGPAATQFVDSIAMSTELSVPSGVGDTQLPRETQRGGISEAAKLLLKSRRVTTHDKSSFIKAIKLLEQALEKDPDFGPALTELARTHGMIYNTTSDRRNLEAAIEYANRATIASPDSGEAWRYKAYAQTLRGDSVVEVTKSFKRAFDLDPGSFLSPYFLSGPLQSATTVDDILEIAKLHEASIAPSEARSWRYKTIESLMQKSLALNPKFAWTWLSLGQNHQYQGNLVEACWCLEKAIAFEPIAIPKTTGNRGYLGELKRLTGDFEAAKANLMKALDELEREDHMYRDTMRGIFLCGLGRVSLDEGDSVAAKAPFTQAVQHLRARKPRSAGLVLVQALAGLARCDKDAGTYDEARALFDGRAEFSFTWSWGATESVALVELGKAAQVLGCIEDARELFKRAREMGAYDIPEDA